MKKTPAHPTEVVQNHSNLIALIGVIVGLLFFGDQARRLLNRIDKVLDF